MRSALLLEPSEAELSGAEPLVRRRPPKRPRMEIFGGGPTKVPRVERGSPRLPECAPPQARGRGRRRHLCATPALVGGASRTRPVWIDESVSSVNSADTADTMSHEAVGVPVERQASVSSGAPQQTTSSAATLGCRRGLAGGSQAQRSCTRERCDVVIAGVMLRELGARKDATEASLCVTFPTVNLSSATTHLYDFPWTRL